MKHNYTLNQHPFQYPLLQVKQPAHLASQAAYLDPTVRTDSRQSDSILDEFVPGRDSMSRPDTRILQNTSHYHNNSINRPVFQMPELSPNDSHTATPICDFKETTKKLDFTAFNQDFEDGEDDDEDIIINLAEDDWSDLQSFDHLDQQQQQQQYTYKQSTQAKLDLLKSNTAQPVSTKHQPSFKPFSMSNMPSLTSIPAHKRTASTDKHRPRILNNNSQQEQLHEQRIKNLEQRHEITKLKGRVQELEQQLKKEKEERETVERKRKEEVREWERQEKEIQRLVELERGLKDDQKVKDEQIEQLKVLVENTIRVKVEYEEVLRELLKDLQIKHKVIEVCKRFKQ